MRLPRPSIVTAAASALTLASVTGTLGFLLGRYPALPPSLPVEFRGGRPYYFIRKSYPTVLTPVWTQLILIVIFGSITAVLLWRAHGTPVDERAREDAERMRHAAEAVALLGLVWVSFQAMTAVGLTQLWYTYAGGMGPFYDFGFYSALVLSVLIGVRAKLNLGRPASHLSDHGGVWRMKQLYFNPSDPALFVPARSGHGLTVNFGRPLAIALMLAILLAGLGAPILIARVLLR